MRRGWGLLLLTLLALPAWPKDSPADAAGRIRRSVQFRSRTTAAIDRGVSWLRKAAAPDGTYLDYPTFPGAVTALAYHTLRVCGVPKHDSAARKTWTALRRGYAPGNLQTYSAALTLMAIAEHGDTVQDAPDDRDVKLSDEDLQFASEIAACLVGGQDASGRWGYGVERPAGATSDVASGELARGGSYDNSNTQYALLGLKSAARCGVPIAPGVWLRSLTHLLAAQEVFGRDVPRRTSAGAASDDRGADARTRERTIARVMDRARGWGYTVRSAAQSTADFAADERGAYASMTAGGVSSIVICRSELLGTPALSARLAADSEQAAWDGLAWLGSRWKPAPPAAAAPPTPAAAAEPVVDPVVDVYEFYGVERAGVLAGVDWMSELDWYGEGAERLLSAQAQDGSWNGTFVGLIPPVAGDMSATIKRCEDARSVVDTCFALLFLKRGTAPVRRGAVTQSGGASDIRFTEAEKLSDTDFGDLLDLVLQRWTRAEDDGTKLALFEGVTAVGPRIVGPLLIRLDTADPTVRRAASALLRHATGRSFEFDADAPEAARSAAVERWREWWLEVQPHLRYDPAVRRLTAE